MASSRAPLIALLTDFGTRDWYVASLKAVILGICPRARLVDITHEIPPQDITTGAFMLAAAEPWFPPQTVFVCVVDPGVGTPRPLLAAQADAHCLVGPDNGLLSLVLQRATHRSLMRLTNPAYWLPGVSQTFHGRDILAPVAAHVASGTALRRLGIPVKRYATLNLPPLTPTARGFRGRIVHIDTFGNLITNLPAELLMPSTHAQIRYHRLRARVVSSYGEGDAGELVALAGSSGFIELAIRNHSAATRYQAKRDDPVELCDTTRPRGGSS